jgi:hypothetical protein
LQRRKPDRLIYEASSLITALKTCAAPLRLFGFDFDVGGFEDRTGGSLLFGALYTLFGLHSWFSLSARCDVAPLVKND